MKHRFLFLLWTILCLPLGMRSETVTQADTIYIYDTVRTATYLHYTDTILHVTESPDSLLCSRTDTIRTDSTDRRGHYIQAYLGGAYGSLGYDLSGTGNRVHGSLSGIVQLQYAYFFHPHWGIGAGLWLTNYTSYAHWAGQYTWTDQTDSDNEQHYDHTATVKTWRERQMLFDLAVPVSLQFQYQKEEWKARLFASLGVAPSFTVSSSYRVRQGQVAHSGYYPSWGLTLEDTHEFGVRDYTADPSASGALSVRPRATVFADLGALLPITPQVDVFVGAYFHCAVNDANGSEKKALGWGDATFAFMDAYRGAYATTNAGASHPWQAGIKVGIHWHHIPPDKHNNVEWFEPFTRRDTSYAYIAHSDTLIDIRIDTTIHIIPAHIIEAAERVEKFNKIYFAFDQYELTNRAKRYLSSIVGVLNEVPDAKIAIDGHASSLGDATYNEILSQKRAHAVAEFLVNKGVDRDRIVAVGYGSRVPNEENADHAEPLDRRVEVKVVLQPAEIITNKEE